MGKNRIKLYVDIVSPFAYLGYWFVRNSPVFKSVEVEYVPILLGGLMKMCDNRPPLQIKSFPLPTITAQRLLCAVQIHSPAHLPQVLDTLYSAFWSPSTLPSSTPPPTAGPDYNINTPVDLTLLLTPLLGDHLTKSLITAISTPEVKAALGKNTDAAFRDGAFGLPWFQCTNEQGETTGFWGFDHLGQVVRFLGLEEEGIVSRSVKPVL